MQKNLFVLLGAIGFLGLTEANADSILGKSLTWSITTEICNKQSGKCVSAGNHSGVVYVSAKGQIFDYSRGSSTGGSVTRDGQNSDGIKRYLRGNQIIYNGRLGIQIFTVRGSTCDITIATNQPILYTKTSGQSCSVSDGPPPQ